MRRDGSFKPLTVLAELLCAAALGLATGCGLYARHRRHSTWGTTNYPPAVHARYRTPFTVETPRRTP